VRLRWVGWWIRPDTEVEKEKSIGQNIEWTEKKKLCTKTETLKKRKEWIEGEIISVGQWGWVKEAIEVLGFAVWKMTNVGVILIFFVHFNWIMTPTNAHMLSFGTLPLYAVIIYYIGDSQSGVGVTPEVRTRTFRDTRKILNGGKGTLLSYLFTVTCKF
jgi:hypothetical protein